MSRVKRVRIDNSGAYAAVANYFEADRAVWMANRNRTHADDAPYPCQRIVDGLRAGEPVNVPTMSLPKSARPPARPSTGRLGNVVHLPPSRAIVRPDDAVTFTDNDWAAHWLEENGL